MSRPPCVGVASARRVHVSAPWTPFSLPYLASHPLCPDCPRRLRVSHLVVPSDLFSRLSCSGGSVTSLNPVAPLWEPSPHTGEKQGRDRPSLCVTGCFPHLLGCDDSQLTQAPNVRPRSPSISWTAKASTAQAAASHLCSVLIGGNISAQTRVLGTSDSLSGLAAPSTCQDTPRPGLGSVL